MKKEKNLFDLKLSELVDQSLAKGVIPFLQFMDKGDVIKGEIDKRDSVSAIDETPVMVLQRQIRLYERFDKKIETRDGIVSEGEDVDKKLIKLRFQLALKIGEFEAAIDKLNSEQNVQASVATDDHQGTEAGNPKTN